MTWWIDLNNWFNNLIGKESTLSILGIEINNNIIYMSIIIIIFIFIMAYLNLQKT